MNTEIISDYITEKTYNYVSENMSDIEQSLLHCWEVKLLDEIRNYQT